MAFFQQLKPRTTILLLAAFLLCILGFQSFYIWRNYQFEKKLLARNLNESMQYALNAFHHYDANADSVRYYLNEAVKTEANQKNYSGKNLILNPDFELGDSLFYSSYELYRGHVAALLPNSYGWKIVGDSIYLSVGAWPGKGYGEKGNLLILDGATVHNRVCWAQQVSVKQRTNYVFNLQIATLNRENKGVEFYWRNALLRLRINGNICGIFSVPDSALMWKPVVSYWNSNSDTMALMELDNINTGSLYNDFAIDHLYFGENLDPINRADSLYMTTTRPIEHELQSDIYIVNELMRDELSFRKVSGDFDLIPIDTGNVLLEEGSRLGLYNIDGTKYFERFYSKDGSMYSTYFSLNNQYICKCRLKEYNSILINAISAPLLLLGSSILLSCIALYLVYSYLLKQEQVTRLKYDITNSITHELKTPVATILAASEALQQFGLINDEHKRKQYIGMMQAQASRLDQLIERSLRISMVEETDFALNSTDAEINKLLRDLINSPEYTSLNSIRFSFHSATPEIRIKTDTFHLTNVLHTIIDNSIKYGKGEIHIEISTRMQQEAVLISIKDNGPGIPEKYQKQVFEKYFRVPSNDRYEVKGHGLGLNYVRIIMDLHKGKVQIISKENNGTEVLLKFNSLKTKNK
jgi:nitrogen-specific signal transduction histidine kinase